MHQHIHITRRGLHAFVAVAVLFGVVAAVQVTGTEPASAMTPPIAQPEGHVTADALPTVQINGVVYDQAIVGNTVYAVGQFTSARPAGAPLGTNETPRQNMLAYNLTTGELLQSFNPTFNGKLKTVTASPDGSRLYVGGLYTNVSGAQKYSLSAVSASTGAVINTFTPILNYMVNDIVATDTTVYAVGSFAYAGPGLSQNRSRLAAFSAANGSLTTWAPSANDEVHSMVMSPKGDRIFVGGAFTTMNGESAIGLAAIDPVTGAKLNWPVNNVVRNSGSGSAILTLSTDGKSIFGSGWAWGQTEGNLEGSFSADPDTGAINWIADCHGDTYGGAAVNGYYYTATHAHYCGNLGAFPQTETWAENMRHAGSYTTDARGTLKREQWGYFNFEGQPAPSQVNWYPTWNVGTFTGASQATWSVTGNSNYVVYGGEFPRVNGQNQQGIVRFAVKPIAPAAQGPQLAPPVWAVELTQPAAGQVRITIPANYDRDDNVLNYRFTRDGVTISEQSVASTFFDRPVVSFVDNGRTAGQTHAYRVWVTDKDGNQSFSDIKNLTISGTGSPSAYADAVLADGAALHWRLGSTSGGTTEDLVGTENGVVRSPVTFGASGAINGDSNTAATFSNNSGSTIYAPTRGVIRDELTIEAWVRTNSNSGGRIAGFSNNPTGESSSSEYDRVLYMTSNGRITFGARTRVEGTGPNATRERRTIESQSGLNNNQWHHVVGTLGDEGMSLFVDGVRVSSRADTTGGQAYYGNFRVGSDTLSGWPNRPFNDYLSGQIDEPALYPSVLTPKQIARHYQLSGRTSSAPTAPSDNYGAAVFAKDPYLYYRLADTSGTTAVDSGIRANTGTYAGSTTRNQAGAVAGNAAVRFNGDAVVSPSTPVNSPGDFSVETWFNTTTTTGGKLIGFGNSRTGNSTTYDRHVYLRDDGRLVFGAGTAAVTTDASFNNGQWHHVVASQGANGMRLYVDGVQVGSDPNRVGLGYTGYWRVGGDTTPSGSTSNGFNGLLDEAAIYDRVLTPAEVVSHLTLAGGQVANVAPTAAFTVSGNFLDLAVNGSTSSDSDGTIASYSWNFGDGSPAVTGPTATANHTYSAAGTYDVTLTVTDDDGAVAQSTQSVQVNAPPPNVPPTASFTLQKSNLNVTVNSAASSDSDGTIASRSWDFGDSTPAVTTTSATHTYAAAGTYTVTLTVTDDDGAVDTETTEVTVTAATGAVTHASDMFERTLTGSFGSADVGGAWTNTGTASWYSVTGGVGRHLLNSPGRVTNSTLGSVSATNLTFATDVKFDKAPTGGGIYTAIAVRRVGTNEYRFRVRALPTGTELMIDRTAGGVGALVAATSIPGLTYTPGDTWRLQLTATGTSPTALTAKVWNTAGAEPTNPQLTASDSTAALQTAGGVGLNNFLSGSATNAPIYVSYDNLLARTGAVGDPDPTPNVAPTASFTTSTTFLNVAVDGSASNDEDGTIVSRTWNFGDGGTANGATANHTYAAAGTYTITHTVTDDDGASTSATTSVTVAPDDPGDPTPIALAADTFERTLTGSFGSADTGGAWTNTGTASWYSVTGGVGRHLLNSPGRVTDSTLGSVSATNVSFATDVKFDKAPTGGGIYTAIAVRRVGTNEYRFRVRALPTGTELMIDRTAGGVGALVANTSIPGLVFSPGDTWRIQLEATGTSPTTLRAKVWNTAGAEPTQPQLTATDSTAALQAPGAIGLNNFLSGSATNAPIYVSYDNLLARPLD